MQYFNTAFIDFFKNLAKNNNKEWFHENKKTYETEVKKPFEKFVGDLITAIHAHDPSVLVQPKDCIGRINRDIRFSNDKTPYNLHYTAFVSSAGKKDKAIPGLYLRFAADEVGIMGGTYGPSKIQLHNIRETISSDIKAFHKVIHAPKFVSTFGEIQGEENKRIPPEFQAAFEKEPLVAKKHFYFVAMQPAKIITSASLLDTIMEHWQIARPVNEYLRKAL